MSMAVVSSPPRARRRRARFPRRSPSREAARRSLRRGRGGRAGGRAAAAAAGTEGAGELPRGVRDRWARHLLRDREDGPLRQRLRRDLHGRHPCPLHRRRRQVLRTRPGLPPTDCTDPHFPTWLPCYGVLESVEFDWETFTSRF